MVRSRPAAVVNMSAIALCSSLVLVLLFLLLWGSGLVVLKTEGSATAFSSSVAGIWQGVSSIALSTVLIVSLGMNFLLMPAYARSGLAPYLKLKKQAVGGQLPGAVRLIRIGLPARGPNP